MREDKNILPVSETTKAKSSNQGAPMPINASYGLLQGRSAVQPKDVNAESLFKNSSCFESNLKNALITESLYPMVCTNKCKLRYKRQNSRHII